MEKAKAPIDVFDSTGTERECLDPENCFTGGRTPFQYRRDLEHLTPYLKHDFKVDSFEVFDALRMTPLHQETETKRSFKKFLGRASWKIFTDQEDYKLWQNKLKSQRATLWQQTKKAFHEFIEQPKNKIRFGDNSIRDTQQLRNALRAEPHKKAIYILKIEDESGVHYKSYYRPENHILEDLETIILAGLAQDSHSSFGIYAVEETEFRSRFGHQFYNANTPSLIKFGSIRQDQENWDQFLDFTPVEIEE